MFRVRDNGILESAGIVVSLPCAPLPVFSFNENQMPQSSKMIYTLLLVRAFQSIVNEHSSTTLLSAVHF